MHARGTVIGWAVAIVALAAVVGCGKSSETPQAAINSPTPSSASATASAGPAQPLPASKPQEDQRYPVVVLETSLGNVTLRLDAVQAPVTVQNFLAYVNEGFFDQTIFHQVVRGKVLLGGTYDLQSKEKPTHTPIRNEAHNGLKNVRGTIGMARKADAVDSATSQFYLNLGDNAWLDYRDRTQDGYGYCVFGRIVDGQDVLDRIAALEVHATPLSEQTPAQPVVLKSVRRTR